MENNGYVYIFVRERIRKTQGDKRDIDRKGQKQRFQMNVILHYLAILKTK